MNKTITLSKKYTAHGKVFDTVELREPSYKDMLMAGIGKPFDVIYTGSGPVLTTHPDLIDAYLQRIIVEPGYECINDLSAIDSMQLEKAVCDFFLTATTSETSPIS